MENINMTAVESAQTTNVCTSEPKHKWLAKGSKYAKKAVMFATIAGCMAMTGGILSIAF